MGFYDASGNYVGLTPLQQPPWFTSTLFANASRYSVDRTQAVIDWFLRATGLSEQESGENGLGTGAVGETEHAKAKRTSARLSPQREPDLRLADGGAVEQGNVDWSRVATTVLAPTVVTVPRTRANASPQR